MKRRKFQREDLLNQLRGACLTIVRDPSCPDLSLRELGTLAVVASGWADTVRGLAAHLRVPKPAITRAAFSLEIAGLVRRDPDPDDGRSILITATSAGRALLVAIGQGMTENGAQPTGEDSAASEASGAQSVPENGCAPGVRLRKATP